jgi:3-methyladenine DNA glycosylase/8-oxoguanine DNA glycosylase
VAITSSLRRGSGDPTYRIDPDGTLWRSCRTPEGPATLRLGVRRSGGEVAAQAWGSGADWSLEHVPALLGGADRPEGFQPRHPLVAAAWHRHRHWRVPATGLVFEALLAAVLEQKVTGQEAWTGWRRLLRRFGEPAPGPDGAAGMRVLPAPEAVARIPSWEWLRCQVDPARSRAAVTAARAAAALERSVGLSSAEVDSRLRSLPGVGVWTAAEVRQRAHGDADAVSFGDYHVARDIGWALTGVEADDDGLAELLEPYRPHRYRVQRLLELTGRRRPRRGPRMGPRTHLPG